MKTYTVEELKDNYAIDHENDLETGVCPMCDYHGNEMEIDSYEDDITIHHYTCEQCKQIYAVEYKSVLVPTKIRVKDDAKFYYCNLKEK